MCLIQMATNNLDIYSLNTNGLRDLEKRTTVINWLKSNYLGITLLQEVHSTESCEKAWERDFENFSIFYSHGTENARGVCTIIPNKYDFEIIETIHDTNGRFLLIHMSINDTEYVIANIYAPTKSFQEQQKQFISYVTENIMKFMGKKIIIGGDFNTYLDPLLDKKGGNIETVSACADMLKCLMAEFNLCDIYREQHPPAKALYMAQ